MHHFRFRNGEMCCEGVPLRRIARDVGTPVYVYSHATLAHHYRVFDEAFGGIPHIICFSMKSNSNGSVVRTFTGQPDGAIDEQWTTAFTPETPLQINQPLPSGTLDISGTLGWTRGLESLDLIVTTPSPLHYDSDCTDTPQRIDDGELHAQGTFDGVPGYVRVRWTECGRDPEIGFVSLAG